jgi:BolA family transcriptional regulator, general stress-responsive regulator
VQTPDNPGMQNRQDRLRAELTAAFAPTLLEIVDDSARHAGHAGAAAGGETHYNIKMISAAFAGQSRVERSRAVHQVLAGEFASGLHALSLSLSAPAP